MAFHKTTPEALGRADEFYHFTEEVPCSFSFCADIDVTAFVNGLQERMNDFLKK